MTENLETKINLKRKNRLYKICFTVLAGYILSQFGILAARLLELSSISFIEIFQIYLTVITGSILFILVIHFKKEITDNFARLIFIFQSALFFIMYAFLVLKLHEMRIIGLFFALGALTFMFSFSTFVHTSVLSIGTIIIQAAVSYYAILYSGQSGSIKTELFFTLCFLPSFLALSYLSHRVNKKKETVRSARKSLEDMNQALIITNSKLEAFHESAVVDMELASNVQSTLFPDEPAESSGWDIAVTFKPLLGISGDFYDFYYNNERLSGMSLFDVSGHGISSGLITMFAKPHVYRLYKKMNSIQLGGVMGRINELIYEEIGDLDNYITGILLRFNGKKVEYTNAGHPDLLIKKHESGRVEIITSDDNSSKGKPIGLFDTGIYYNTIKFEIEDNDLLIIYSDCLMESSDSNNEFYGLERLINTIETANGISSREIMDQILKSFYSFIDTNSINDDLTVIVAKKIS